MEFISRRQWHAYASRVYRATMKREGRSLTQVGIERRASAYITEIREDGLVVKAGWREAMKG